MIKYFLASDTETRVKFAGESPDGEKTVFYVAPTPFGSATRKDLHGEWFHPGTYFGDDKVKSKPGLYEHLINDLNNPIMAEIGRQKQLLGQATLLSPTEVEDRKLTPGERWFALEVSRSLDYHDMLFNMVQKGMMGASTQCFYNGKTVAEDGRIDMWVESEVSLTPTPANPASKTSVIEVATPYFKSIGDLVVVDGGDVRTVVVDKVETPVESISDQIAAILADDVVVEEPTPAVILADDQLELSTEIKALREQMDAMSQTLATIAGSLKTVQTVDEKLASVETSLLLFAKMLKSQAVSGMSAKSVREERLADTPKIIRSGVPDTLRIHSK